MGWRITGAALMAGTVLAGLLTVWSWLGRQYETQSQTYSRTATAVEFDVDGPVSVDGGIEDEVVVDRELTWSAGKPRITETWTGTTLRITARCEDTRRLPGCSVAYRATVPAGAVVAVRSSADGVTARDLAGDLTVEALAGDVDLAGLRGRVAVTTDTGAVRTRALRSPAVTVDGEAGNVELRFQDVPGEVLVHTEAGDIDVEVPGDDAYAVLAGSDAGRSDVDVRTDPTAPRVLRLSTGSGDITVAYAGP